MNGNAIGSVAYSGAPLLFDQTHLVQIGTNIRYDDEWFRGVIDEVSVYNYALSPGQIAEHYKVGIEGPSGYGTVPTLSEWGIVSLIVVLGITAIYSLRSLQGVR